MHAEGSVTSDNESNIKEDEDESLQVFFGGCPFYYVGLPKGNKSHRKKV